MKTHFSIITLSKRKNFGFWTLDFGLARRAFTLVELLVVIAVLGVLATVLVPAVARVQPNSQAAQCVNNHRQMVRAWEMFAQDNNGALPSSFPGTPHAPYGSFTGSWCGGTARTGGADDSYGPGGGNPSGIQDGVLWPYSRSLSLYHCPADQRIVTASNAFQGKPILRSISMNCYLNGESFGTASDWVITSPNGPMDPQRPVYTNEALIKQPKDTFVFIDEDGASIEDGLFLTYVANLHFYNLPSRAHQFGYGISFTDGHTEIRQLKDAASKAWKPGDLGGINDWLALRNVTTHPL